MEIIRQLPSFTFRYNSDYPVNVENNILYLYFKEDAFVMIEEQIDEKFEKNALSKEIAFSFFEKSVHNFQKGNYKNGKLVSDISSYTIGSENGWRGLISSDRMGIPIYTDIVIVLIDGYYTMFTLMVNEDEYENIKPIYNKLLLSVKKN